MVATRHKAGSEEEEGGSERDLQQRRSGERRRVDPVIKEAHKRGLDVDKLHDSRTPAWRNLRGRGGRMRKQKSYYEGPEEEDDELPDQPPSDEEEEGEDGGEESEEEQGGEEGQLGHRYARRVRQTVQRYSPEQEDPPPSKGASGKQQRRKAATEDDDEEASEEEDDDDEEEADEEEDSEEEEEEGGGQEQDNDLFAARYSVRQRRQVEFFNPVQYEGELGGSQQPVESAQGGSRKRREREQEQEDRKGQRRRREQSDGDSGADAQQHQERRQYSFRDRALVTIKPASQQAQPGSQVAGGGSLYRGGSGRVGGGQHERKRARLERRAQAAARLHRTSSRGRLREFGEDEVENPDEETHLGGGGMDGGQHPYGGAGLAGGAAPWDAVRSAAANLPLSHLGREKAGNAEITPLQVDPSVSFDMVGGLDHYIKALKEMIFLPLVYPELFERFHIAPPRGVLFYGPPGTGKTLVARALAAHASRAGKKVSFFMRKGADVLSKWVGEAERQLRLLFEEAQRHQPSIIFFDEIDGLAPVRSSKQDQIHNSIVSTLLALMDGLDARGQVVVIGATNRVDALDGALRRPGRFDRELVFPLPNLSARGDILRIHTSKWAEPPKEELLQELASLCVGYCGADLKALCTEASLASLRRHYPQIYEAEGKLLVDPGRVRVQRRDFLAAFQTITPASHRSAVANARPLPPLVAPVLLDQLQSVLAQLQAGFPAAAACLRSGFGGGRNPAAGFGAAGLGAAGLEGLGDDDGSSAGGSGGGGAFSWASGGASLGVQRPRLLVCGPEGSGQGHLGPAVLYALEGLPVHAIGLPSLLSDAGARAPEEALVHAVVEARRAAPAVLFLPHLQVWWDTAPNSLRATLWMLLADLPADLPLLLFATADVPATELDPAVRQLFNVQSGGAFQLEAPTHQQRSAFFKGIAQALALPPRPEPAAQAVPAPLPVLPPAPEAAAAEEEARKKAEEAAARQRYEEDQAALRALRMALRDLTLDLLRQKRWDLFAEPESDEEWWDKVSEPMDLASILSRVDARAYSTTHEYLADVAKIAQCSRQFWGTDPRGLREISRACALEDEVRAALDKVVPAALRERLEEMARSGGPAPPPASLLALPGVAPHDGGKTPGAHLRPRRQPPAGAAAAGVQSDDVGQRRATRHAAAASLLDDRLLHTDPEAAARHIRALKKQQLEQVLLASQQEQGQQEQVDGQAEATAAAAAAADGIGEPQREGEELQQQQPEGAGAEQQQQMPQGSDLPACAEAEAEVEAEVEAQAATAGPGAAEGAQQRDWEVLAESTKENLPEPAAAAAAVAAATPMADAVGLGGAAASGKGGSGKASLTLTAVVQQRGSSRLRCEGSTQHPVQGQEQEGAAMEVQAQRAEEGYAAAQQEQQPPEQQQQQQPSAAAEAGAAAAAGQAEEEPAPYEPAPEDHQRADRLLSALTQQTEGLVLDHLESIHAKLARLAVDQRRAADRDQVADLALAALREWIAARQQA